MYLTVQIRYYHPGSDLEAPRESPTVLLNSSFRHSQDELYRDYYIGLTVSLLFTLIRRLVGRIYT